MKSLITITLSFFSLCFLHAQKPSGLKDVRIYHPNGVLKVKATELNGKTQGMVQTFYDNGIQKTETYWKEGIQRGATKRWFRNGKLNYAGFVDSVETGEWKYYNDLDGSQVYSVIYQNGSIRDYSIAKNKYFWRPITMSGYVIDVQFPLPVMDSIVITESMKGCFTMYPFKHKRELEYYGLFSYDKRVLSYNPDTLFAHFKPEDLRNSLGALLYSGDTIRPNFFTDKFTVTSAKKIFRNANPMYELKVLFTDLDLSFEGLLIPHGDQYYLVFAYFRKEVLEADRINYFSSVSFR